MNRIFLVFIFSAIISCIYSQGNEPLYFVQITDTHLGYEDNNERTAKVVEMINKLPFDIKFVVHTGDVFQNNVSDKSVTSDADRIFSMLNYPIFFVPGNHDILFKKFEATKKDFIDFAGYTDTTFTLNDIVFMFFYTEQLRDGLIPGGDEKLEEIKLCLEKYKDKKMIIFSHTPSESDFFDNSDHENWEQKNAEDWEKLLNNYNVLGLINGHFHRNEMHWAGKIPVYVAPAIAGFWGRQASFRIYLVNNNMISYKTVYVE
jgi:UDP-2,3-diacylglucosamine pyrophosphatase LpxH